MRKISDDQLRLDTGARCEEPVRRVKRPPRSTRIVYARGFPYGAPLAMVRGGGTQIPEVKEFLKAEGFRWGGRYAWEHYLDRQDFGAILKTLRDRFGLEVVPKDGMDSNYLIDLDHPKFRRPGSEVN